MAATVQTLKRQAKRQTPAEGRLQTRAKVTSKGQITLPIALRKKLGIGPGDNVLFEDIEDRIVVSSQRRVGVFAEFRGSGTGGMGKSKQAILDWIREFRGDL